LNLLGVRFGATPQGEGVLDFCILFISILCVTFVTTRALGGLYKIVTHVMAIAERQPNPLLKRAVKAQFTTAQDVVDGLTGPNGYKVVSNLEMESWFRSFFELGGDQYIGIDTTPPGAWMGQWEFYLRVHRDSIHMRMSKASYTRPDCRVIVAPSETMRQDRSLNEDAYERFALWHWNPISIVSCYWLDPNDLPHDVSMRRQQLPTGAVALWKDFAILFEQSIDQGKPVTLLKARFPGRPGVPSYDQVQSYVNGVLQTAQASPTHEFRGGDVELDLVEEAVAQRWNDYVGLHERISGQDNPLGDFLFDTIKSSYPDLDCIVLDAAAGVGCDALYLIKKGLRVDINEADPHYAEVIRRNADDPVVKMPKRGGREPSARLALYRKTWQDLRSGLPEGSRYDVVLVLGNSFCLVEPRDRARCLRELTSVLFPRDGTLIIDERNFAWMTSEKNRERLIANPLEHPSAKHPDVVYRGDSVRGCPVGIADRLVQWRIFEAEPPVHDPADLSERWIGTKKFELYPFAYGELHGILRSRFRSVVTYGDLQRLSDADMPSEDISDGAPMFFTYVASGLL
jgi:hypothetical protein